MTARKIRCLHVKELVRLEQSPYLVKGFLSAGATSVFFGPPKTRKSFIVLDLAAHIALGREWCSRKVLQGAVVYVVGEGWQGINKRIEAWCRHHEVNREEFPLYIMQPVKLGSSNGKGKIEDDVEGIVAAINELGIKPVLIVLDTLNRTMVGDENNTREMTTYIHRFDLLRVKTGAHVLIVHHTGWTESRARGSRALQGAVDTECPIAREEELTTVGPPIQRDHAEDFRQVFEFEEVKIGEDEDGDKMTSLVPRPTDREPVADNGRDKLAFDTLSELAKRDRISASKVGAPCDGKFLVAQVSAWRAAFLERCEGKTSASKKKAFNRARKALVEKGGVGVAEPWAWPIWDPSAQPKQGDIPF